MKKDLTNLIEREERLEQRLSITLSGLFATTNEDDDMISVRGELHPIEGDALRSSIKLTVSVFDSDDRIIEIEETYIDRDNFFGFELFDLDIWVSGNQVRRLRVHPSLYDS